MKEKLTYFYTEGNQKTLHYAGKAKGKINDIEFIENVKVSLENNKSAREQNHQLLNLLGEMEEVLSSLKETSESNRKDSHILHEFIINHVNEDEWINYLKDCRDNPKFANHIDEIELRLAEYGEDRETQEWLEQQKWD